MLDLKKGHKAWEEWELTLLRNSHSCPIAEVERKFKGKRSYRQIVSKKSHMRRAGELPRLKRRKRRLFTEKEDLYIKKHRKKGWSTAAIAGVLRRNRGSIRGRMILLGLK